jgi:hypothetical protein
MKSIPVNSIPASTPNPGAPNKKKTPQLSEAAVMLLPGLHHARSLLDVAIRVLAHFANEHPQAVSDAEAAARLRRLQAAFGHRPLGR